MGAAVAAGPDSTLWVYDSFEKRVKIHTDKGELIDSIMPIVDQETRIEPASMAVYHDGRFLLYATGGEIFCFRRDGSVAWRLKDIPGSESDTLPLRAQVSVDSAKGLIYVADMTGKRILKQTDGRRVHLTKEVLLSS